MSPFDDYHVGGYPQGFIGDKQDGDSAEKRLEVRQASIPRLSPAQTHPNPGSENANLPNNPIAHSASPDKPTSASSTQESHQTQDPQESIASNSVKSPSRKKSPSKSLTLTPPPPLEVDLSRLLDSNGEDDPDQPVGESNDQVQDPQGGRAHVGEADQLTLHQVQAGQNKRKAEDSIAIIGDVEDGALGAEGMTSSGPGDELRPPPGRAPSHSSQGEPPAALHPSQPPNPSVHPNETQGLRKISQPAFVLDPALASETASLPGPLIQTLPPTRIPDQNQTNRRPWPLQTHLSSNSIVTEAITSSPESATPETPTGLGIESIRYAQSSVQQRLAAGDLSRQSSVSDFGTYMGANRGFSSVSSESGYDFEGGHEREGEGGPVPPPKPKKSHARKQPEGHIKRARNAFILFRKHITDSNLIPATVEVKHQNISVVAAKMWREAPQEVRAKFQEQARLEKEEHQRKYPGYRYQPVFRRTDIIRRRVRKDPAEDEKVDAVAEALIKGKAGGDLESEIKEQLVQRSEDGESDADAVSLAGSGSGAASGASGTGGSSRRRRRDVGQLSKGALRAQRAQNRAKAMRQNLLGSSLLNMQHLYNHPSGVQPPLGALAVPNHPGAHLGYVHESNYMPVGYGVDGRPIMGNVPGGVYHHGLPGAPGGGATGAGAGYEGMEEGMYRIPRMDGGPPPGQVYDSQGQVWPQPGYPYQQDPEGGYWDGQQGGEEYYDYDGMQYVSPEVGGEGPGTGQGGAVGTMGMGLPNAMEVDSGMEYRLPPLIEGPREGTASTRQVPPFFHRSQSNPHLQTLSTHSLHQNPTGGLSSHLPIPGDGDGEGEEEDQGEDPRMRDWTKDGQQTPSGHVQFNEKLFDGALGSAGLGMGMSMGLGIGMGADLGGGGVGSMSGLGSLAGLGGDEGEKKGDGEGDLGLKAFDEALGDVDDSAGW